MGPQFEIGDTVLIAGKHPHPDKQWDMGIAGLTVGREYSILGIDEDGDYIVVNKNSITGRGFIYKETPLELVTVN